MCAVTSEIKASFLALMASYDSNAATAQANKAKLFGNALRLAFHDAGEVLISSADKMGPDGCLSSSSDNAGLVEITSATVAIIEPEWQKFCGRISRADFWALYAKLVVEYAAAPEVNIVIPFYYGRKDATTCEAGSGRLPQAAATTASATLSFFATNMGLSSTDAVTLLGAHTLGRVSISNSGFGLPASTNIQTNSWDGTPDKFDNKYYTTLLNIPWTLDPAVTGTNAHLQDYIDRVGGNQIMLNADMSLGFNILNGAALQQVCGGGRNICGREASTLSVITSFTNPTTGNNAFVQQFSNSYVKMVNVGYSYDSNSGKLGTLTKLTC